MYHLVHLFSIYITDAYGKHCFCCPLLIKRTEMSFVVLDYGMTTGNVHLEITHP